MVYGVILHLIHTDKKRSDNRISLLIFYSKIFATQKIEIGLCNTWNRPSVWIFLCVRVMWRRQHKSINCSFFFWFYAVSCHSLDFLFVFSFVLFSFSIVDYCLECGVCKSNRNAAIAMNPLFQIYLWLLLCSLWMWYVCEWHSPNVSLSLLCYGFLN